MTTGASSAPPAAHVLRRVVLVQAVLVVLFAGLATAAVLTYRAADARARTTEDVLLSLRTLRAQVLDAETGLRGYLLVERRSFLDPYRDAFPKLDAELDFLRVNLDEAERADLDAIAATMDEWRTEFAEVVLGHLEDDDREAALSLAISGAGKARTDRIRDVVDRLEARVRDDVGDQRRMADQRGMVGLVLAMVTLVLLVATVFSSRRRIEHALAVPLRHLADAADRFGAGALDARASGEGVAEVERLAAAFNAMAARIETTVLDLRSVDAMKSEFVSVVSHELRTPLTSIRGSLGLLASGAMGELPPETASMISIAVNNTDRLVRLINDILDLERIESGREALDLRPTSIADVMRDAAEGVVGAAGEAGVVVDVQPVDVTVDADPDRIVQALTNLLGNAIKFSQPGDRIVLRGERRDGELRVAVEDQGRGIPSDKLEAIFDRFQQVDATDAREKGGTGLGLAIVRSIATRHGGRVEVTSEVGVGSTFTLVLPLAVRPPRSEAEIDAGADVVMVVEDDADVVDIVTTLLNRHGVRVAAASTAGEAIEQCRDHAPDVLVLDVRLAAGNGYDVVRALRQDDRLRALPTVVYTVSDLLPDEREALRLGETVFLTKGERATADVEQEVLEMLARSRRV